MPAPIRSCAIFKTRPANRGSRLARRLPDISPRAKWIALAYWYVGFCLLYTLTGQFHLRRPTILHAWRIDEVIPFLDWTVWVYFSQYLLLLGSVWLVRKTNHISRLIYSLSLASLIGFAIFAICPTELPRQPHEINGLSKALFRLLYAIDTPANCFPSLHVALAFLTVPGVAAARRPWTFSVFIWAGLIAISTLTTKQHNFVDVLGGLALAILCHWLMSRRRFHQDK